MKEELQQAEQELAAAEAARDEALALIPNPPDDSAPDGDTDEDAEEIRRWGDAADAHRPEGAHRDRPLRHGARRTALGRALRLHDRRHRARRARALPLRDRRRVAGGLPAGAAAGARARGGDVRHGLLPDRPLEHLRGRERQSLSDRNLGGRARRAAHGRDPRGAAALLRRVLDELQARGRRGGQGHARDVPRAPVQQGRDVRLLRARQRRPTSTSGSSRSRSRSCRGSASRTASSTSPPATSARPPSRSTTAKAGSRRRSATASSRRRRTRPTSRRGGSASATATGRTSRRRTR